MNFTLNPMISFTSKSNHSRSALTALAPVSYTHLTLPTNREV